MYSNGTAFEGTAVAAIVRDELATGLAALCSVGPLRAELSGATALGAVTDVACAMVPFPAGNTIEPVMPLAGGSVAVTEAPFRVVSPTAGDACC
jgi:hypothetical protein